MAISERNSQKSKSCECSIDNRLHTSNIAAASNFPQNEAESVHVGSFERVKVVRVDHVVQHFWGQVSLGTDAVVERNINRVGGGIETYGQA